jgi:YHS domain-containing protein
MTPHSDPAEATATGNTLAYHDATYYFCAKEYILKFQNDPAGAASGYQGDADD